MKLFGIEFRKSVNKSKNSEYLNSIDEHCPYRDDGICQKRDALKMCPNYPKMYSGYHCCIQFECME